MTTKPKAKKFRIRRNNDEALNAQPADIDQGSKAKQNSNAKPSASIDEIRKEGLTGRQLRTARRVAQKKGLAVTSDFDAVRQLRDAGVDPFKPSTILDLVAQPDVPPASTAKPKEQQKPAKAEASEDVTNLPSTDVIGPRDRRVREIFEIQRDIAKRRRKRLALLFSRLLVFVFIPTFAAGWYFTKIATPMYATKSEFVIQQADSGSAAGAGLGGLFQGTSMATQQDSIAVQSFLESRSALVRLNNDHGFKEHFSDPEIDALQRLEPDATNEAAYKLYSKKVKMSYDPTEGIVRMEVIAADPQVSLTFSEALIGYAEEQIDQLTQRLREDQMAGARSSYEEAEKRRATTLERWLTIQEEFGVIDPTGETAALTGQISSLDQQRQQLLLNLSERLNVRRPNEAQVDALRGQIAGIEELISDLRQQMATAGGGDGSLASRNTELRLAEENYTFQTLLVQQALTQMEAAQIEANRQVRYLSLGVEPVAPDEPSYPRAIGNTLLAFLIFAGLYLMVSLTASILREQVSS